MEYILQHLIRGAIDGFYEKDKDGGDGIGLKYRDAESDQDLFIALVIPTMQFIHNHRTTGQLSLSPIDTMLQCRVRFPRKIDADRDNLRRYSSSSEFGFTEVIDRGVVFLFCCIPFVRVVVFVSTALTSRFVHPRATFSINTNFPQPLTSLTTGQRRMSFWLHSCSCSH